MTPFWACCLVNLRHLCLLQLLTLKDKWASLIAQLVKNPRAMQETLVQSLDWDELLEKGQATHFSILGLPLWLS